MKKIRVSLLTKVVIAIAAACIVRPVFTGRNRTYLCNLQFIVRQLPIILHPLDHIGAGDSRYWRSGQRSRKVIVDNRLDRLRFNSLLGFLHVPERIGYIPAHTTNQHGTHGDGESGGFHADPLLRGKYAAFNGCHDSPAAILYDWPRAF